MVEPRGVSEANYIRLTDLAKIRIARNVIYDVAEQSLPERDQITRLLSAAMGKLEGPELDPRYEV